MSTVSIVRELLQPQPIGIYPGAAAHLLLPELSSLSTTNVTSDIPLTALMHGRLDEAVPAEWQFFQYAASGDIGEARRLVKASLASMASDQQGDRRSGATGDRQVETDLLRQLLEYNLFVLEPSANFLQRLLDSLEHPQLLIITGLTAYAYGLVDELPDCAGLPESLQAWGLACQATAEMIVENWGEAGSLLDTAVDSARHSSPLLAAILLGQVAQVAAQNDVPSAIIQAKLEEAIELAELGSLPLLKAELYSQLGMLLQRAASENRLGLQAAVRAYQLALQTGITAESQPVLFAELQSNLALAYLAMPNSGTSAQLRSGIAIQSFRRGLEALDREQCSEVWARISMNLANALQYAPSSHPAENLIQAVELYEEILQVRTRARDPLAYAWVIYNQANALAHLGMFKPALEKAAEASRLFHWYEQSDGAESSRELVHRITERMIKPMPSVRGNSK